MSISSQGNSFLTGTKKSDTIVGRDVVCFCGKCKLNLSHTVVTANTKGQADRVLCNTCKSEHSFRGVKSLSELKKHNKGVDDMAERDEEVDLDLDSGGKALLGDAATKKRSKAKPKARRRRLSLKASRVQRVHQRFH